jgi:HK97 gp10 family phage protein
MAEVTVRVDGLKQLEQAIDELTLDMSRRVVRGALRDAAQPVVRGARVRAPVLTRAHPNRVPGTIRRNIAVFNSKDARRQGMVGVYIRVRRLSKGAISAFKRATGRKGAQNPFDPFYWWFLEFGTRYIRKRRYLSDAFDAARGQVLDIFGRRVGERIARANRRRP